MKKKIIFILWFVFALLLIGFLFLGRSARQNAAGEDVKINIEGDNSLIFLDEKNIARILKQYGIVKGVETKKIDLAHVERMLEKNPWIRHAKIYFDNDNNPCVSIEESDPIARVFALDGNSFYIDSACRKLPLRENVVTRIPVVTSFTSSNSRLSVPDSLLLRSVRNVSNFIVKDTFWNAFVGQVNITPEKNFEIVPIVGDAVVKIGNSDSLVAKFNRLYSFYKGSLLKTGFGKYETIDVRYNNQVVATLKGGAKAQAKDTTTLKAIAAIRGLPQNTIAEENNKTIKRP